jgi:hypothetical protein
MPLQRGYSKGTISKNISELMRSGTRLSRNPKKRQRQAIAIALSQARRSAEKRGVRPARLFKGKYGRRRSARHRSRR